MFSFKIKVILKMLSPKRKYPMALMLDLILFKTILSHSVLFPRIPAAEMGCCGWLSVGAESDTGYY